MLRAFVIAAALVTAVAAPAHAQDQPDVAIAAEVAPGIYVPGQEVTLKVTVTNRGTAEATNIRVGMYAVAGSPFEVDGDQWGDLDIGRGATIEPGGSRSVEVVGTFYRNQGDMRVKVYLWGHFDPDPANDEAYADFDVVEQGSFGRIFGFVFGDENGNGQQDESEEPLVGATVRTNAMEQRFEATTDEEGRFCMRDLPVRYYSLRVDGSTGDPTRVLVNTWPEPTNVVIAAT